MKNSESRSSVQAVFGADGVEKLAEICGITNSADEYRRLCQKRRRKHDNRWIAENGTPLTVAFCDGQRYFYMPFHSFR